MPSRRSTSSKNCAASAIVIVPADRRAAAADRADRLHRRAGAGRSDPAQQPARHLHQFRQPARPVRLRGAVRRCAPTARRSASRCSRPAGRTRCSPSIGRALHADTRLPLGATGSPQPPLAPLPPTAAHGEIAIAVVGAHLSGMPLNGELKALGARLLEDDHDRAGLQALCAGRHSRRKPGLLRVAPGTARRSRSRSGRCPRKASGASSPRSRRRCRSARSALADGRAVKGFLVEAEAVARRARHLAASAAGAPIIASPVAPAATAIPCKARIPRAPSRCERASHRRRALDRRAGSPHHTIVLDMRLGEPAEIAELGAPERLHPRRGRQRHLGQIADCATPA